ncbi:MAG: hypothetical protein Q7T91_10785 [Sulfuricurvum sp.]|nr:hypothetical protein [Sulfuricurvum sp.]
MFIIQTNWLFHFFYFGKRLVHLAGSFSEADQLSRCWSFEKEGADMLDPTKHHAVRD